MNVNPNEWFTTAEQDEGRRMMDIEYLERKKAEIVADEIWRRMR